MSEQNIKTLDSILLSNNVVDNFYNTYNNNQEFRTWLDAVIPDIEKCEKQEQNNPWHKYNVLGHILHSVEEMNKMTQELDPSTRRMLAYTMLFHDIGKPDTHIVRNKDGKLIDSFFGHNERSCEIIEPLLPQLNFSENACRIILKLVHKHDIFMFIKEYPTNNPYWRQLTDALIEDEIKDLNSVGDGYTLLKYLIMVGKSDNLAQNENLTSEPLHMLEKFQSMLENISHTMI